MKQKKENNDIYITLKLLVNRSFRFADQKVKHIDIVEHNV